MALGIVYTASLDTTAKVITTIFILLAIGLCYWSIRSLRKAKRDMLVTVMHMFIIFVMVSVAIVCFLFSPKKYVLGNFDIAINRPIGDVVIHVKDITEIRGINPGELDGTERTFGVDGLFGYYGNYYNKRVGNMKWYATRHDNMIMIHTRQGETIIISPDDKDFGGRILAKMQDL